MNATITTGAPAPSPKIRAATPRAVATALLTISVAVLWCEWSPYYLAASQITREPLPHRLLLPLSDGFAISLTDTLFFDSHYGAYNMGKCGVVGEPRNIIIPAASTIHNPSPFEGNGRGMETGIGAAARTGLTLVCYWVPWWPLHPIGLVIQGNFGTFPIGMSALLA